MPSDHEFQERPYSPFRCTFVVGGIPCGLPRAAHARPEPLPPLTLEPGGRVPEWGAPEPQAAAEWARALAGDIAAEVDSRNGTRLYQTLEVWLPPIIERAFATRTAALEQRVRELKGLHREKLDEVQAVSDERDAAEARLAEVTAERDLAKEGALVLLREAEEALEFEAISDCCCPCCVQRVTRSKSALARIREAREKP